jgi:RNA polymerase sigma factor (sigma-70 family)
LNPATIIPTADTLVQQCIDGDTMAYRLLYNRYAKAMYNTALRIVNRTADAEDILQESFIDAFDQLKKFQNKSTFGAWLKQIVVFKSISFLKKQKMIITEIEEGTEKLKDDIQEDEDEIKYTVKVIKQAVKQLPDGYRTVLSLYLFEGYDHEEIAEILQTAKSTVRTQYIRAKQKLLHIVKKGEVYEQ